MSRINGTPHQASRTAYQTADLDGCDARKDEGKAAGEDVHESRAPRSDASEDRIRPRRIRDAPGVILVYTGTQALLQFGGLRR